MSLSYFILFYLIDYFNLLITSSIISSGIGFCPKQHTYMYVLATYTLRVTLSLKYDIFFIYFTFKYPSLDIQFKVLNVTIVIKVLSHSVFKQSLI